MDVDLMLAPDEDNPERFVAAARGARPYGDIAGEHRRPDPPQASDRSPARRHRCRGAASLAGIGAGVKAPARIDAADFGYEISDERLLAYSALPIIDRLRWLDEIRRFTLAVRAAPESVARRQTRVEQESSESFR